MGWRHVCMYVQVRQQGALEDRDENKAGAAPQNRAHACTRSRQPAQVITIKLQTTVLLLFSVSQV